MSAEKGLYMATRKNKQFSYTTKTDGLHFQFPNQMNINTFLSDGHGLEIWTKDCKYCVEIGKTFVVDGSFYFYVYDDGNDDGKTSAKLIARTNEFGNALIASVGYLNTTQVEPLHGSWWMQNYVKDAMSNWYIGHDTILRDKYLDSGHVLLFYGENDTYGLRKIVNFLSYFMVYNQDKKSEYAYFDTYEEALHEVESKLIPMETITVPKALFDICLEIADDHILGSGISIDVPTSPENENVSKEVRWNAFRKACGFPKEIP